MFTRSAAIYDAIYGSRGKDYAGEVRRLEGLIDQFKTSPGNWLLDVACGTGRHVPHFQRRFQVEGLDLEEAMLAGARARNPEVTFHQADMRTFELDRQFDVIVCLFSAIAYVQTVPALQGTIANFSRHLAPGGVAIVEPFHDPDQYRVGGVHATFVDEPDLKIARMNVSERRGNLAVMDMHYQVGTPAGIETFTELHELAMFTRQEYQDAFRAAGLQVHHDEAGLIGRGLFIGVQTLGS